MTAFATEPGHSTDFRVRIIGGSWWRIVAGAVVVSLLPAAASAAKAQAPRDVAAEFGEDVALAPFVVNGQQLPISIHARSKRDRKYAEAFANQVVKVVYEGVTEQLGYGLVIIGANGEPHPVVVFRQFQEMAEAGQLDPEVAAQADNLSSFLRELEAVMDAEKSEGTDDSDSVDVEFEKIVDALPLPLEGVGARLYQLAWAEGFDDARVAARLQSLKAGDLAGDASDMFARFDWVFYLPPRGAFDHVLKEVIDQALKEGDMGFFTRMVARTALTVVKPIIRRAIEGMRKGMMFMTVVRAQTDYTDDQVFKLTGAYMEVLMPGSDVKGHGSEHDNAVWAVRQAVQDLHAEAQPAGESDESASDVRGQEAAVE